MTGRAQLLAQKLELLQKIALETERMVFLLQNKDLDALSVCIEKKNGYIECIDGIDRQLQELAPGAGEEPLLAEILQVLQALMETDRRARATAETVRAGFSAEIRGVNHERSLMAYGATPQQSKFVDREG